MRKFPSSTGLAAALVLLLAGCATPPPPTEPPAIQVVQASPGQGVSAEEIENALARVETGTFAEVDQLKRKLCLLQHEKEARLLHRTSDSARYRLRYGDG
jgi:starvation-inducible outer membrane lipoprotein